MRKVILLLLCLYSANCFAGVVFGQQEVSLGDRPLSLEVAKSQEQLMQGLMYRDRLEDGKGMLFVFENSDRHCFWMRNTRIPLSLAFLDEDGKIVSMVDMEPMSDERHCSVMPARYGLEVPQGWFQRNGIAVGARVESL